MLERFPGLYEITVSERPESRNIIQLYLVRAPKGQRSLLIDSGYGTPWCEELLMAELEEAGVSPIDLDVFLTHKHADHCGLAHALETRGARLFMNREEDRHQYDCLYYRLDHSDENAQKRVLTRTGITEQAAPLIYAKFMDFNFHLEEEHAIWLMSIEAFNYEGIQPGQRFDYGDFHFEAVPLRGHTYGQMGLVDHEKRLLLPADQLLNHTAPIVGTSHVDEHLLAAYLASIRTLAQRYAGYTILPAHEGPLLDPCAACERTTQAYQRKLGQTLACVLEGREQTVWQIACHVYVLTPDKRSDAAFTNAKMITTKTFSMLEYLFDQGLIQRREAEDGMLFWSK